MMALRTTIFAAAALGCGLGWRLAGDQVTAADGPRFTASGQLLRPADYREWVWLSSGIGMAYGPNANEASGDPPFDNVFVNRSAHRSFLTSGAWPDGTILVLEIRASASKRSINRSGHFQADLRGIEAEVKQGGKWSFYRFEAGLPSGARIPDAATCYSCHAANGAVDNTFVQFYPTLIDAARARGTFHEPAGEAR
jgi:hypothetical protein